MQQSTIQNTDLIKNYCHQRILGLLQLFSTARLIAGLNFNEKQFGHEMNMLPYKGGKSLCLVLCTHHEMLNSYYQHRPVHIKKSDSQTETLFYQIHDNVTNTCHLWRLYIFTEWLKAILESMTYITLSHETFSYLVHKNVLKQNVSLCTKQKTQQTQLASWWTLSNHLAVKNTLFFGVIRE